MKLTVKKFAAWSKWSRPDIAQKIAEIANTSNTEQLFDGKPFKEKIENAIGKIDIPLFWYGSLSILKIYNGWMWTNDPKYAELKKSYKTIKDDCEKIKEGQAKFYKLGDLVVVVYYLKDGRWFTVRKYKDTSNRLTGWKLTPERLMELIKPFKPNYKNLKINKVADGDSKNIYGKYDELNFGNKSVNRRKSPFPIPVTEYDLNLPDSALNRILVSKNPDFSKYLITDKCIKHDEIPMVSRGRPEEFNNNGLKGITLKLSTYPQDYLAFCRRGESYAVWILNEGEPLGGRTGKVAGVFNKIKYLPSLFDKDVRFYPLKRK